MDGALFWSECRKWVAHVKHSKHCDEHYKEALEDFQIMGTQFIAHLDNGQYNEDDADISTCRQQEKLRVMDEMLFE